MSQQPEVPGHTIYPVGERAIAVQWGEVIDEKTNDSILSLFQWLKEKNIHGITDLIPAYQSLTLVYDPVVIRKQQRVSSAFDWLHRELSSILDEPEDLPQVPSRQVDIPVCYDPSLGPDLGALSREKGLSMEAVVHIHSKSIYRVYMIGFLPGFAYMGIVDERIAAPRKREPVLHIEPGSVGIAGIQTGVYPLASPGGWHIIGRTPMRLFDARSPDPVYLRGGDKVRFIPISLEEYHGYTSH